tara:strand:+ start:131 stop:430 length:300 start_codon:yes stop_codon:yes gene_type:complete
MDIKKNTLVFSLSENTDFNKIDVDSDVRNFIADLTSVSLETIKLVKDKFITFEKNIKKMNGSFVIVSDINFNNDLIIVPTIQEAYDYIELEEIEKQLNI